MTELVIVDLPGICMYSLFLYMQIARVVLFSYPTVAVLSLSVRHETLTGDPIWNDSTLWVILYLGNCKICLFFFAFLTNVIDMMAGTWRCSSAVTYCLTS